MKQNKSLMIFLSCASGAGIGYLLAVRFGVHLWWLGVLVGGVIGYLVYDIKQIVESIPRAWQYAKEKNQLSVDWKIVRSTLEAIAILGYIVVVLVCVPMEWGSLVRKFLTAHGIRTSNGSLADFGIIITCLSGVYFGLFLFFECRTNKKEKYRKSEMDFWVSTGIYRVLKFAKKNLITYFITTILSTPIALVLFAGNIILIIARGVLLVPKYGELAIKFAGDFQWKAFKLIHSDLRILVLVYSVSGGTIGYFCHSILFGMLVGGIGGVVTYKLILIRWLKLQPKN